jgi:hypothetical protein
MHREQPSDQQVRLGVDDSSRCLRGHGRAPFGAILHGRRGGVKA